jgi:hypothetical protein
LISRLWNRGDAKIIASILFLVFVSRAVILFTGYTGMNLFSSYSEPSVYERNQPGSMTEYVMKLPEKLSDAKPLGLHDFYKYDTYAYMNIATNGYDAYSMDEPHPPANWVFFPLYPMLVKIAYLAANVVAEANPVVTGIVLSNLFFAAALYLVYRICLQQGLSEKGGRAVLLMIALYPASMFFSLAYTESLFLLLSAASIYFASDKRYALAFAAAGLSTVTRVPGFVNLVFVGGMFLLDMQIPIVRKLVRGALYGLISLVPMIIYLLYMKRLTGDFLAPFHEQDNWFRETTIPFSNYFKYFFDPYFITPGGWDNGLLSFAVSTAVILVYLLYAAVFRKRLFTSAQELLLFACGAMLIVIPFASHTWSLASVVRYMKVSLPFYLYLVRLYEKREGLYTACLFLFAAIQSIYVIGFFNGYYFMA